MRFKNKVAIVTGGAGSIGLATVRHLAKEGACVLLVDRGDSGEQSARELRKQGLEVIFQSGDVAIESDVLRMVQEAENRWGTLNIMIANAGVPGLGKAEDCDLENWQKVMDVNVAGVFLCAKHAIPAMKRCGGGSIVATASVMGLVSTTGATSYCASKGAVVNLTRSIALDYAEYNIRVNSVCPGHLETRLSGDSKIVAHTELVTKYPMNRLGTAEEVANAIAFLASDEASFITGTALAVDGGYSAA
ncbi:SDR family NAD(P)-dependent oxidoreductase [Parahaliea maris]|nr:SDR family NAD(P)-dependent oxidoreductase [Parahaliea maris]